MSVSAKETPEKGETINLIKFDDKINAPKTKSWNVLWFDVADKKNESGVSKKEFINPPEARWHLNNKNEGSPNPYIRCTD